MKWENEKLKTYPDIIEMAMSLKGKRRKKFIKQYTESGRYALSNIGYFAGYYGPRKARTILKIFSTKHPIFGGF